MDALRLEMYAEVVRRMDTTKEVEDEEIYQLIDEVILDYSRRSAIGLSKQLYYRRVLFAAFRRLDILSILLDDETVTEVMVNRYDCIFVEKRGRILRSDESFTSEEKLYDVIQKIVSSVNRRVNVSSPLTDARLPDGSRIHVALPPVSIDGPALTIRKFSPEGISMRELVACGSISEEAAAFLKDLVRCRYNIFISGGTGAGKTTFLGALSEFIPEDERVITIEDSAELKIRHIPNLIRLESRMSNTEGENEISIRTLIVNALRMRPDRIIVGEIRSAEALDMLQAMNTGHDGSISTGHANSASDMLSRIETMVLMGGMELPISAIRSQIASGIDILVHLSRFRDKTRKVYGIYEICGVCPDGSGVLTKPLYLFKEEGTEDGRIKGRLEKTGELENREKYFRNGGKL